MMKSKTLMKALWLCVSLYSSMVFAQVITVSGNTGTRNVTSTQSANIRIVWNVTLAAGTALQLSRVRSASGFLTSSPANCTAARTVTQTINVPISRTITPPTTGVVTVVETLHIPVNFLYDMRRAGCRDFTYSRAFEDDGVVNVAGTLTTRVATTGSLGGDFGINLISVRFDDGSPKRIVERNGKLGVYARITYSGTGLLKGTWEIAEPSSTLGQPIYRPLREVYQFQPGIGQNTIKGPLLPTKQRGIYHIRFNVKNPAVGFTPPTIRYYVYGDGKKPDFGIDSISLRQPENNSLLNRDTQFEWSPVQGASAIQIEIYSSNKNPLLAQLPDLGSPSESSGDLIKGTLVAGKVVQGSRSSMQLDANSLSKLKPGQWYVFRLIAFNAKGKIIAVSRPQRVLSPSR